MKRVKSAFKQCSLKRFDLESSAQRSTDGRSSAGQSSYGKFKSKQRVRNNHYLAGRVGEYPLPSQPDRQSNVGYVKTDKEDIASVMSAARSLLVEGKLNSSAMPQLYQGFP